MTDCAAPHRQGSYTYFDLLSILCYSLYTQDLHLRETICQQFRCNYEHYYMRARDQFPFLSSNGSQGAVYYYDLQPDHAKQICDFLKSAKSGADWAVILAVIEAIDQLIERDANLQKFLMDKRCAADPLNFAGLSRSGVSRQYYRFSALNPSTAEYGLLMPRTPCRWDRSRGRSADSVAFYPMYVMTNYLWAPLDANHQVVNLYSDFHLQSNPNQHPRLKIVTSPLCSRAPFRFHCQDESKTFVLEYLDSLCAPTIDRHFEKALNVSVGEKAHILMFPEMMASPASIRHCVEYIRSHWELDFPNLILLPTCEYKSETGWVNTLTALDAEGNCIFSYHKQHPFQYDRKPAHKGSGSASAQVDSFLEPIHPDNIVYILHVPGVGRIGFLICADVFQDGYLDYLTQHLKITLLLHVVYSAGEDLLLRHLAPAQRSMCDVVLCNTCAAWDDAEKALEERPPVKILDKSMINIYLPYGHKCINGPSQTVTCPQGNCTGCTFVMELPNEYNSRNIHIEHRYD